MGVVMGSHIAEIRNRVRPEGECEVWTGEISTDGYGVWRRWPGGGASYVHRVLWQAVHGRIGKGVEVHHRCRNRRCCRLEHLEALSREEHRAVHGLRAG